MMVLKLIGGGILLAVGAFSAYHTIRYEKKRLSVLEGWLDLVLYIRSQIDCFLTPLHEILAAGEPSAPGTGIPDGTGNLSALLKASSVYLDEENRRFLEAFVREIGSGYREEQLHLCDYYIGVLRTRREKAAAELPRRIRACRALCLCIAAGSAILLW